MAKSAREKTDKAAPSMLILSMRLRAFMEHFGLNRSKMAALLRTPRGTFDHWLDDGVSPPACLAPLLDLLEGQPRVRTWLGVHASGRRNGPRGRPFGKGNPYRFTDPRRHQMIAYKRRPPKALT